LSHRIRNVEGPPLFDGSARRFVVFAVALPRHDRDKPGQDEASFMAALSIGLGDAVGFRLLRAWANFIP
jgi:hypothetical protein